MASKSRADPRDCAIAKTREKKTPGMGVSTGVEHDQEREQTEAPVGPWIWRWKGYRWLLGEHVQYQGRMKAKTQMSQGGMTK